MKDRWVWIKRTAVGLLGGYALWLLIQAWPAPLTPGPTTTVISGPKRSDGTIDYAAALNDECFRGVAAEANAAALLWEALGSEMMEPDLRESYQEQLGYSSSPPPTKPFHALDELYGEDYQALARVHQQMDAALAAPWTPDDYPELARWLSANDEALRLCADAGRLDRYFDPLIPPADGTLLETTTTLTQETRSLVPLIALRVTLRLGMGQVEESLEDSATLHRLSRLISQHPLFISQLAAYSYSAAAIAGDAALIQSGLLTETQARKRRDFFAELPPFPPLADLLNHGERFAILDSIQKQTLAEWQPNAVLSQVNLQIDELVAALRQPNFVQQRAALTKARQQITAGIGANGDSSWRFAVFPRQALAMRFSNRLTLISGVAIDQMLKARAREVFRYQLADTGYALAGYRARHGRFPESLQLLVPEFLSLIPDDPFGNGPVRYLRNLQSQTFLLYSIGENGIDEQGQFALGRGDDIGFGAISAP